MAETRGLVSGFDLKMEWHLNKNLVAYLQAHNQSRAQRVPERDRAREEDGRKQFECSLIVTTNGWTDLFGPVGF